MKRLLLFLSLLILLPGCFLKSVHPLVADKDAVLLDGLEGTWLDGNDLWTFINDPRNVTNYDLSKYDLDIEVEDDEDITETLYLVLVQDITKPQEEPDILLGKVAEIGDYHYLDLTFFRLTETDDLTDVHLFPVHTFSRVQAGGDELSIEFFKSDWISELIEANRVRIKHEKVDDQVLITASTRELQQFVEKYGDDDEAFDDPIQLKRTYDAY